jgi:hypothetical protein
MKLSLLNMLTMLVSALGAPNPTQPLDPQWRYELPKPAKPSPPQSRAAEKKFLRSMGCAARIAYRLLERANKIADNIGAPFNIAYKWAIEERSAKVANDKRAQFYSLRRS